MTDRLTREEIEGARNARLKPIRDLAATALALMDERDDLTAFLKNRCESAGARLLKRALGLATREAMRAEAAEAEVAALKAEVERLRGALTRQSDNMAQEGVKE